MEKAKINFAAMNSMRPALVTEQMLEGSAIGIKGWAAITPATLTPSQPQTSSSSNAAVAKAKPSGKGGVTTPSNEREHAKRPAQDPPVMDSEAAGDATQDYTGEGDASAGMPCKSVDRSVHVPEVAGSATGPLPERPK